jgi:hypothetical protein
MSTPSPAAVQLARRLRELREQEWQDTSLTQAALAEGLSSDQKVGAATVSSWESTSNPKLPPRRRIEAYARFFATRRTLEPTPRLLSPDELTPEEEACRSRLEEELLGLHEAARRPQECEKTAIRRSWQFDDSGPVTIICPDAPHDLRGPLASSHHLNYTDSLKYADLDALIELYGHLRAENPAMDVFFRRASRVSSDDLSGHLILLGGVSWNKITKRLQSSLTQLPIRQVDDPRIPEGDIFVVTEGGAERPAYPTLLVLSTGETFLGPPPDGVDPRTDIELVEDIAWFARMPNPFNSSRTLTICNGVFSRGVLGAVRCLTDTRVRETNENYLASRFPDGDAFTLLMRVPVFEGKTLSPDLQASRNRLFEWPPRQVDS